MLTSFEEQELAQSALRVGASAYLLKDVSEEDLPAHGTLSREGNGLFTYAPTTGYVGPDSFRYRICDSVAACDEATVMVFAGWEQLRWESDVAYVAFEDPKNVDHVSLPLEVFLPVIFRSP